MNRPISARSVKRARKSVKGFSLGNYKHGWIKVGRVISKDKVK